MKISLPTFAIVQIQAFATYQGCIQRDFIEDSQYNDIQIYVIEYVKYYKEFLVATSITDDYHYGTFFKVGLVAIEYAFFKHFLVSVGTITTDEELLTHKREEYRQYARTKDLGVFHAGLLDEKMKMYLGLPITEMRR